MYRETGKRGEKKRKRERGQKVSKIFYCIISFDLTKSQVRRAAAPVHSNVT